MPDDKKEEEKVRSADEQEGATPYYGFLKKSATEYVSTYEEFKSSVLRECERWRKDYLKHESFIREQRDSGKEITQALDDAQQALEAQLSEKLQKAQDELEQITKENDALVEAAQKALNAAQEELNEAEKRGDLSLHEKQEAYNNALDAYKKAQDDRTVRIEEGQNKIDDIKNKTQREGTFEADAPENEVQPSDELSPHALRIIQETPEITIGMHHFAKVINEFVSPEALGYETDDAKEFFGDWYDDSFNGRLGSPALYNKIFSMESVFDFIEENYESDKERDKITSAGMKAVFAELGKTAEKEKAKPTVSARDAELNGDRSFTTFKSQAVKSVKNKIVEQNHEKAEKIIADIKESNEKKKAGVGPEEKTEDTKVIEEEPEYEDEKTEETDEYDFEKTAEAVKKVREEEADKFVDEEDVQNVNEADKAVKMETLATERTNANKGNLSEFKDKHNRTEHRQQPKGRSEILRKYEAEQAKNTHRHTNAEAKQWTRLGQEGLRPSNVSLKDMSASDVVKTAKRIKLLTDNNSLPDKAALFNKMELLHKVNDAHEKRGFFSRLFFISYFRERSMIKNLEKELTKAGVSREEISEIKALDDDAAAAQNFNEDKWTKKADDLVSRKIAEKADEEELGYEETKKPEDTAIKNMADKSPDFNKSLEDLRRDIIADLGKVSDADEKDMNKVGKPNEKEIEKEELSHRD